MSEKDLAVDYTLKTQKNMALWNRNRTPKKDHTKKVTYGRTYTAIDLYHIVEMGTREWGPMGGAWGVEVQWPPIELEMWDRKQEKKIPSVALAGKLYFPNSTGGVFVCADTPAVGGQDTLKKLNSSLISKAMSFVGMAADIFLGRWDDEIGVDAGQYNAEGAGFNFQKLRDRVNNAEPGDFDNLAKTLQTVGDTVGLSDDMYLELYNRFQERRASEASK